MEAHPFASVGQRSRRIRSGLAALLAPTLLAVPTSAFAAYELNLHPPATDLARDIYDLHTLILWICAGIFVVVFVPMAIALIRHRRSVGHEPAKFHDNTRLEILWTVIPTLILVGIAWPATSLVRTMKDTSRDDLTIKVTGHQWKWEYEYLGDDIQFMSNTTTTPEQIAGGRPKDANYLLEVDRPLVVPTGKKIRLVLTASDVIHSWWIPAFGVKQDAIPGFIRDTWFRIDQPGTYRGQCAELCGVGHGYMPVVVEAVAPEAFAQWKDEQKTRIAAAKAAASKTYTLEELKALGEKVYATNCAACHQPTGKGIPGAFPSLVGSKLVTGDPAGHIAMVLDGKSGTAMAAFGKQLGDLDLAAVITYERHAWGNNAGGPVQPSQVAALRK